MRSPRNGPGWLARAVRDRRPELAAAAFGLLWFLVLGGWRTVDPTQLDWLAGDQRTHALGWFFFRASRWALPLGRIDGYAWPIGTTVGFTDANPLLAVLLKPFSPLLPRDFQYVGWWLAACFALQGAMGARIAGLAAPDGGWYRLLAGAFFALAPVLAVRTDHATLCAHFVILLMLYLLLRPSPTPDDARRSVRAGTCTVWLVTVIHPVLAAMALVLLFALCIRVARIDHAITGREAWRRAIVALLADALVLLAFGYVTAAPSHLWGFGWFSADPLGWLNPMYHSRFLPPLPVGGGQYEGFSYPGLGGLLLLGIAAVAWRVARLRGEPPIGTARRVAPALALCLLMYVFALSSSVRVLGHEIADLRWAYAPIYGLVGPYRSSGRFVWPLHYLLLAMAVVTLPRLLGGRRAVAVLAGVVAIQLADVSVDAGRRFRAPVAWRLRAPEWSLMRGAYRHLALVPPQVLGIAEAGACRIEDGWAGDESVYASFAYQAYATGLSTNSAYLSRGSGRRMEPTCRQLLDEFRAGTLRDDTVYVVGPNEQEALARHPGAATCGRLDGFVTCVSAARTPADPFARALAARGARREP